ncbi:Rieske 2Fe-2S domain-containing protein [Sneathiella sp. CAU 1612]|uniref:Rieske 2Fe-2S domain-containing protein n=1 Tax=Sneathiella sedimenti TaxID=2816034 RepID=A0ABS3F3N2_9PROT|nr:Rieske 2Fe-2S domain-containing protein [Sneathiella sedimenti]MBO0333126.1 Rieske 2Fe-2S domain-containing protein [Sneathiella sedimenti]
MKKETVEWRTVASIEDIAADRPLEIIIDETFLLLVKVKGDIKTYQGLCPHQFAKLSMGTISEGFIHCPRHKACFDAYNGKCGPGWQLPALRQYHIRVDAGEVAIAYPLSVISPGSE